MSAIRFVFLLLALSSSSFDFSRAEVKQVKCQENPWHFLHLNTGLIEDQNNICTILELEMSESDEVNILGRTNYTELEFYRSKMPRFSRKFLETYGDLEHLSVSHCGVKRIENGDFAVAEKLKILSMRLNELKELKNNTFLGAVNLETIDLSHNPLQAIEAEAFHGLVSIRVISLGFTNLKRITSDNFKNLKTLVELRLYFGNLEEVDPKAFITNTGLKHLDVEGNQLKELELIFANVNMTYIDVSNNQLSRLVLKTTSFLYQHCSFCELHIDARDNSISNFFVQTTFPVNHLDLVHNELEDLKNVTKLSTVEELGLSRNPLGNLDNVSFSRMENLKTLSLSQTQITSFNPETFAELDRLRILDISYNNLPLNFSHFPQLSELETLDLSGLNLTSLPENVKETFPALKELLLSDTNFNCSYLNSTARKLGESGISIRPKENYENFYFRFHHLNQQRQVNSVECVELEDSSDKTTQAKASDESNKNAISVTEIREGIQELAASLTKETQKTHEIASKIDDVFLVLGEINEKVHSLEEKSHLHQNEHGEEQKRHGVVREELKHIQLLSIVILCLIVLHLCYLVAVKVQRIILEKKPKSMQASSQMEYVNLNYELKADGGNEV